MDLKEYYDQFSREELYDIAFSLIERVDFLLKEALESHERTMEGNSTI